MPALTSRPRILVAEDDDSLRRLMDLRLTVDGYEVKVVGDGAEALTAIPEWTPAVFVCDVMMPRVSGLTVCRELRGDVRFADLPIVLLTAHSIDADIEAVVALGGITFMNKPFNATQLKATIDALLAASQDAGETKTATIASAGFAV